MTIISIISIIYHIIVIPIYFIAIIIIQFPVHECNL